MWQYIIIHANTQACSSEYTLGEPNMGLSRFKMARFLGRFCCNVWGVNTLIGCRSLEQTQPAPTPTVPVPYFISHYTYFISSYLIIFQWQRDGMILQVPSQISLQGDSAHVCYTKLLAISNHFSRFPGKVWSGSMTFVNSEARIPNT